MGHGGRRTANATGLALALLAGLLVASTPSSAAPDEPVRILVVGDSITQGSAGDWTWRYRLWQHLTEHGVSVDFVGPRDDLWDNVAAARRLPGLRRPGLRPRPRGAAGGPMAAMGRSAGATCPIGELVTTYHPDVVVEMLGVQRPGLPAARARPSRSACCDDFVDQARVGGPRHRHRAWPDPAAVALARSPTFNAVFGDLAARARHRRARGSCRPTPTPATSLEDTCDGAHPNARGELKIAAAVADALPTLGVGPARRPAAPRGAARARVSRRCSSTRPMACTRHCRPGSAFAGCPGVRGLGARRDHGGGLAAGRRARDRRRPTP